MNNNITPAHVTYEQAVWLRDLHFNQKVDSYFIRRCREDELNPHKETTTDGLLCDIKRPEQHVVVEWLRVNFGVNIQPFQVSIDNDNYPLFFGEINNNGVIIDGCLFGSWFETPQEAYSAALSYLMSNEIIKQK